MKLQITLAEGYYGRVRVVGHLSTIRTQENGIPQGSPLSGTLFMLPFDGIFSVIKYPVAPILFADDLSIHISANDQQRAHRKLQETIDLILE